MGRTAIEGNTTIKEMGISSNRNIIQKSINDLPTANESMIYEISYLAPDKFTNFTNSSSTEVPSEVEVKSPHNIIAKSTQVSSETPIKSNTGSQKTPNKKAEFSHEVKNMHNEVIVVLNKINDNILLIAENFSKLVTILENQTK